MKKQLREYMKQLGKKGGKARKKALSKSELSEQGRKAVQARWAKKEGGKVKASVTPLYDKAKKLVQDCHRNMADIDGMTLPELKRLIEQLKLAEQQLLEIRLRADKNAEKLFKASQKARREALRKAEK